MIAILRLEPPNFHPASDYTHRPDHLKRAETLGAADWHELRVDYRPFVAPHRPQMPRAGPAIILPAMSKRLRRTGTRVLVRNTAAPADRAALRRVVACQPHPVMLESLSDDPGEGRYSIYAWNPIRSIVVGPGPGARRDPLAQMAEVMRPARGIECPANLPFAGGWIGFLSYEAGRFIEPSAGWRHDDRRLPLAQWRLYDAVAVDDPHAAADSMRPAAEGRLDEIAGVVERANAPPTAPRPAFHSSRPRWNLTRQQYLSTVRRAQDYIAAGDVFQVNIARRLRVQFAGDALALYERLCTTNPAALAAYVSIGSADAPAAILSSSPELFLRLDGDAVTTRPIKGTAPRLGDASLDDAARSFLMNCPKNAAELNMIIDLVRNDLGRVCRYGTVRVEDPGLLEAHPTVFHRTATVTGRLRPECDAADLIRATFPGGSVTGAPKVRAMQIIDELEPDARGPYCGAIGYVGLDGRMQLNLAIRTMTASEGSVTLHVGSGIVADSDPHEECAELDAKSAGMIAALGLKVLALPDAAETSTAAAADRVTTAPLRGPVAAGVGHE
jgi:para-aminobenzoate synthetase component 1